ncbi:MAG TPA: S9 family peptidase [Chloroflexota bacterium]|nr:S9 family peptidase [Chloroflexota bacterium]
MPSVAPYGTWKSPITSDAIVAATVTLGEVRVDGEDVYWYELRPAEGGRAVIVRRTPDGRTEDVNPAPFSARTRVHEYGGAGWAVHNGTLYFTDYASQALYRLDRGREPRRLTPETEGAALRYAEMAIDARRGRLVCVRESHAVGSHEPKNEIVAVHLDAEGDDPGTPLVSGADFYAAPRLSADGSRLAWLQWQHPNMPWDGTELWEGALSRDGAVTQWQRIAGGDEESIFQPEYGPDGALYFTSDRSGWGNLYRRTSRGQVEQLTHESAEFAAPQWVFGLATYDFDATGRIACSYVRNGDLRLGLLDLETKHLTPVESSYTSAPRARSLRVSGMKAYLSAASPTEPTSVIELDLETGRHTVLRRASDLSVDPGYVSAAQAISFPTEGGQTAHAFYYPPRNKDFAPPEGARPPLVVKSHGGPTSATTSAFDAQIQYWTSRGLAVLDVNYGGSTGYGREYMLRLRGTWGITDVDDCANGAKYLVEQGLADGKRLAITGGSAGGYTTLCALTFHSVFTAGASHYGVSDLEALAQDTHKFESRYLDSLIGPYPERKDVYVARSPIHHVERLSCPVIFTQGLDDPVVPPSQTERMVAALERKGIPVAYVPFAGERHGYRKAENIKRALDAELYFYGRVWGFQPADPIEPVEIRNLP